MNFSPKLMMILTTRPDIMPFPLKAGGRPSADHFQDVFCRICFRWKLIGALLLEVLEDVRRSDADLAKVCCCAALPKKQ